MCLLRIKSMCGYQSITYFFRRKFIIILSNNQSQCVSLRKMKTEHKFAYFKYIVIHNIFNQILDKEETDEGGSGSEHATHPDGENETSMPLIVTLFYLHYNKNNYIFQYYKSNIYFKRSLLTYTYIHSYMCFINIIERRS